MNSIVNCTEKEIDLRSLFFNINWSGLDKKTVVLLVEHFYNTYLHNINTDFVNCCEYSHGISNRHIDISKISLLVDNFSENDNAMFFSIFAYLKSNKVKTKSDVKKFINKALINSSSNQRILCGDIKVSKDYDMKNHVKKLLNEPIIYSGAPEGTDLEISITIYKKGDDDKYILEIEHAILGYCLNYDFREYINTWIYKINYFQDISLCKNATISYDAMSNIHMAYHRNNILFDPPNTADKYDYLFSYDWGMLIPMAMFYDLGGYCRANEILVNPIIQQCNKDMVWIFIDRNIIDTDIFDKRKLKNFYYDFLLPGYNTLCIDAIRSLGEIVIEEDENIQVGIEPYILNRIGDKKECLINDFYILFRHGDVKMDEL